MRIRGKHVDLRPAEVADAEFILALRLDRRLNQHLSPTDSSLEKQAAWLRAYKERERQGQEYYFIVEGKQGEPYGTNRMCDFQGDSFACGSWILRPGSPPAAALESALLLYDFAFGGCGFARARFEVRRQNERVLAFHRRMGARLLHEDEDAYHFEFLKADYALARQRYARFLGEEADRPERRAG